jgi:hypothetical protein
MPTGRPRGRPRRTPPPPSPTDIADPPPPTAPIVPEWREIPADAPPSELAEGADDDQRDTIAVRYFGEGERWTAEVTLGPVLHELGSFTTASKAMNAALKFYYEQRPAAKRRQYGE